MLRVLLITVFLAGCVTSPRPIPPELQYIAPAGQESTLATLLGFREKGAGSTDHTAYVLAIDGKRVMAGSQGWSTPLPIQPGRHDITVAFQSGPFNTQADLQLEA